MSNLIGPESKIYEVMSWFSELVIINFLIIITSLPVLTAGSSLRAGHQVIGAMIRSGSSAKPSNFIKALPTGFFRTTLVWVGFLGLVLLAGYESWVIHNARLGWVGTGFHAALLSALLLLGMMVIWFFHLDTNQPQQKLGESVVAAISHAIGYLPRSLCALAPWLLLILIPLLIPQFLGTYVFFVLVIGPALAIYLAELALQWPEIKDPNRPLDGTVEV